MKKALFILMITTIALTGFRKSDALVVSFNNDNSKAIDLSTKNTLTALWSVTADTTKKGGGRGNETSPRVAPPVAAKEGNGGKLGAGVAGKGGNGGNAKKEADGNGGAKKDLWVRPAAKTPQGNGGVGKDTAHSSVDKPFPLKNAAPDAKEGNGGKLGAGVAGKGGNGGVGKDTAHSSVDKPFPLKNAAPAAAKPGNGN